MFVNWFHKKGSEIKYNEFFYEHPSDGDDYPFRRYGLSVDLKHGYYEVEEIDNYIKYEPDYVTGLVEKRLNRLYSEYQSLSRSLIISLIKGRKIDTKALDRVRESIAINGGHVSDGHFCETLYATGKFPKITHSKW